MAKAPRELSEPAKPVGEDNTPIMPISEPDDEGDGVTDDEEAELHGLTDAEREELDRKAKELVKKETKKKARENYLTLALARERAISNQDPHEEKVVITLDLAGHSDNIKINGIRYNHGQTYTVPRSVYSFLMEKMQAGWRHEEEIGGANRDIYRRPKEFRIGPKDITKPNQAILRG